MVTRDRKKSIITRLRRKTKNKKKITERWGQLFGETLLDSLASNVSIAVHHQLDSREDDSRVGVVQPGSDTLHNNLSLTIVAGGVGANGFHNVNLTPPSKNALRFKQWKKKNKRNEEKRSQTRKIRSGL